MSQTFFTRLTGYRQIPPIQTRAYGTFKAKVNKELNQFYFSLSLYNIKRVFAAHLHHGTKNENGPVVAYLYGCSSGIATNGISVVHGMIKEVLTEENLLGPLQGKSISDLIELINQERIYVNVHTKAHPDGEIRGQVKEE